MDDKNNYGVINEQGYVGAQLGFAPLNEQDSKAVEAEKESEKKDNE